MGTKLHYRKTGSGNKKYFKDMMRVLQLIDSLEAGGAERMAANLSNVLLNKVEASYLCATRGEGILKETLKPSVGYLYLNKKLSLDPRAFNRLRRFVKVNRINIIHAHSTSFFLATLIKLSYPKVKIIWHDHYGESEFLEERPKRALQICSYFFSHILSVNDALLDWSRNTLNTKNMSYMRNFVLLDDISTTTILKGKNNKRILCLANLRPQKDHITLFKAFESIVRNFPDWSLHCIGKSFNDNYAKEVEAFILEHHLEHHIFLYGSRKDIRHIISQCEIGILSSTSEGLPIALLEYGLGKLAVIVTDVGYCSKVITDKSLGVVVPSRDVKGIELALNTLISDIDYRRSVSECFNEKILKEYGADTVIEELIGLYQKYGK